MTFERHENIIIFQKCPPIKSLFAISFIKYRPMKMFYNLIIQFLLINFKPAFQPQIIAHPAAIVAGGYMSSLAALTAPPQPHFGGPQNIGVPSNALPPPASSGNSDVIINNVFN